MNNTGEPDKYVSCCGRCNKNVAHPQLCLLNLLRSCIEICLMLCKLCIAGGDLPEWRSLLADATGHLSGLPPLLLQDLATHGGSSSPG